jgi:triosephosphate isomerase
MHEFIRETVRKAEVILQKSIYPLRRKCEARKCKEIFSKPDVDGLIGGAAKADDFVAIVNI